MLHGRAFVHTTKQLLAEGEQKQTGSNELIIRMVKVNEVGEAGINEPVVPSNDIEVVVNGPEA